MGLYEKILSSLVIFTLCIVLLMVGCSGSYRAYQESEINKIKVMQEKKRIENETLKLQIEAQKVACDCIAQQQYIQSRRDGA